MDATAELFARIRTEAADRAQGLTNRQRLDALKVERGCVDCGYNAHPAALQFDHVRGVKVAAVARLVHSAWPTILEEIAKCDVRCANCHAVATARRGYTGGRPRRQARVDRACRI